MSVTARDIAACNRIFVSSLPWRYKAQAAVSSTWLPIVRREMISRELAGCKSLRRIQELGGSASTTSREVARNVVQLPWLLLTAFPVPFSPACTQLTHRPTNPTAKERA